MEEEKIVNIFRLTLGQLTHVIYYCVIWWKFGKLLNFYPEWNKDGTIAVGCMLGVIFLILQVIIIVVEYKTDDDNRGGYLHHLPVIAYLGFVIGPYGMFLHHQYKLFLPNISDNNSIKNNNNTISTTKVHHNCLNIQIPDFSYIIFQIGPMIAVLTYLLHPCSVKTGGKERKISSFTFRSINTLDILNLITFTGCLQTYSSIWLIVFYIGLSITSLLLIIPLNTKNDDDVTEHNTNWLVITSSVINILFNDTLFGTIRIVVMVNEKNIQFGFVYLLKNVITIFLRSLLIWKTVQRVENVDLRSYRR